MKKLIVFMTSILVLGNVVLAKADDWYDDFEPGSYFNPYVIEKAPLTDEYEIRPKYPFYDDRDYEPGGYFNPYTIEKDPLLMSMN